MSSSATSTDEFFRSFPTIEEFKQTICSKVIDVIRTSNRLAVEDFERVMTIASCREKIQRLRERLLTRIHRLKSPIQTTPWNGLEGDEQLEQLIDVNDTLFEQIASALDRGDETQKTWVSAVVRPVMTKPQEQFKWKIDNSVDVPFISRIRQKPHAKTPLPSAFDSQSIDPTLLESHPYFDEIESFEPDESLLKYTEPQLPKPIEETKCLFVDTEERLRTLMAHLSCQTELAIDLEHHSYRSYQGFTCLMQISSRTEDFLVDTLLLRDQLTVLNEVFTNPQIVKVFHGADWDIEWLQKDFGLYVVNMFDTHQAGKELNLPTLSLAYLLKHYCHHEANKQFQLADWRLRPLPEDYLRYAREDTHYLLYIYDCLRNQLLDVAGKKSDRLRSVYQKSKVVCQKVYKKPSFDKNAYKVLYYKSQKNTFDGSQLAALKSLYAWRDRIAREDDESLSYVLPDLMLIHLADVLPKDIQGIRSTCKIVPGLVEKHFDEIQRLLTDAIHTPLSGFNDDESSSVTSKRPVKEDSMSEDTKRMKLLSTN